MRKFGLWVLGILCGIVLLGCAATQPKKQEVPPVDSTRALLANARPKEGVPEGSLWRNQSSMASLFSDPKARDVGDVVTISIVESSSATGKATTDTNRDSTVKAGVASFLGYEKQLMNKFPNFSSADMLEASLKNDFKGSGNTARSGTLTASITAKIVEVLPNGNYVIEGRRDVEVNHENQYIIISGIIRPEDISRDNVVLSTFISDARIAYSGRGVVDDYQQPGWFTRILNKVWPF